MSDTRTKYPDDTIPGWLRKIRDGGSEDTARAALLYGSERRTVEIAQERLDTLADLYASDAPMTDAQYDAHFACECPSCQRKSAAG